MSRLRRVLDDIGTGFTGWSLLSWLGVTALLAATFRAYTRLSAPWLAVLAFGVAAVGLTLGRSAVDRWRARRSNWSRLLLLEGINGHVDVRPPTELTLPAGTPEKRMDLRLVLVFHNHHTELLRYRVEAMHVIVGSSAWTLDPPSDLIEIPAKSKSNFFMLGPLANLSEADFHQGGRVTYRVSYGVGSVRFGRSQDVVLRFRGSSPVGPPEATDFVNITLSDPERLR